MENHGLLSVVQSLQACAGEKHCHNRYEEQGWRWSLLLDFGPCNSVGRTGVSSQGVQSSGSIFAFLCCSSSLGVAYTSECFPCKPGTYADKQGSSFCKLCPANSYSNKGETSCHQCDPDKYSGDVSEGAKSLVGAINRHSRKQEVQPSIWSSPRPIILKPLPSGPCQSTLHQPLWK